MRRSSLIFLVVLLSACRTPPAAMDQANHGVSLSSELEKSLAEFHRIQTHSQNARAAKIREQQNSLALAEKTISRDMRVRAAVGDTRTEKVLRQLLTSTDALAAEDAAYVRTMADNDKAVAALLTPLPTTKESTSAAQAALAALGEELSGDVRRGEFLEFSRGVKTSVDEAKKKIAAAEAEASEAKLNK